MQEVILKRVDIKGLLVEDLMMGLIDKKLQEIVDKSDNSLDNALKDMIMPELIKAVENFVDSKLAEVST